MSFHLLQVSGILLLGLLSSCTFLDAMYAPILKLRQAESVEGTLMYGAVRWGTETQQTMTSTLPSLAGQPGAARTNVTAKVKHDGG